MGAGRWREKKMNLASQSREWPELKLTPERAGYSFVQDICQVANGSVRLAENMITGTFQCVKCFDKSKMEKDTLEQMREEVDLMFTLGTHRNIGGALEVFQ